MKKIMKIFVLLFFAITYSLPTSAKLYMGKITMQVGETRSVEAVPPISAYTASGSFSKSGTGFWISANGSYTCRITATYAGKGTLSYWGSVARANTWTTDIYDLYWDVEVKSSSGGGSSTGSGVLVNQISTYPSSLTMEVGDKKNVLVLIMPPNATNQKVEWSSDNPTVASVSSDSPDSDWAVVEAKSMGTANIICKTTDGSGKQAICPVEVRAKHGEFKANNANGIEIKFHIVSEEDKTCAVGGWWSGYRAIAQETTGTLVIPSSVEGYTVTEIGEDAFSNCASITSVELPSTINAIGNGAFNNCASITSIELPSSIKKIKDSAFSGCTSLKHITGISGIEYMGSTVFRQTPWYDALPNGPIYIGKTYYGYKGEMPENTTIKIKEGIKSVAPDAFTKSIGSDGYYGHGINDNLIAVEIPASVVQIGRENMELDKERLIFECPDIVGAYPNPFDCPHLQSIVIDRGNEYYESPENCNAIIEKRTGMVIAACNNTVIPASVTIVAPRAFGLNGMEEIKTLVIPDNVQVFGGIDGCENLENLVIGKNVEKIGRSGRNSRLISVYSLNKYPSEIDENAFENNTYEKGTLYVPTGSKNNYIETTGWSKFKNIVEFDPTTEPWASVKGDVNGDNQVNGTDLVALTNIILGKSSKTDAADVNGDGYVNGTDYVALANIVLGRSNAKATAMAKGAIQAAATTGLSIEPFDIKAGETKEMVIDLTNPNDDITLVQFDLRLPKGLSVKQSGGEYDFDIAGRTTWRKHSLDANATNGIVRFLLASSSNATLTGTEGAVIKITIAADNNFTGGDIQLENILMVTPAEKEIKQDVYTYHVGQSQPSPSSTGLAIEPFSISAGSETEMVIDLNNPDDEITLVQFDLRLPNGLSVKQSGGEYDFDIAGRTTWRKHSLDANATNGIVRFLLASSSNATLTGTEGAVIKITLKADNSFASGAVKLENILLVTPAEKEIKQSDVNYTIGTTGIKSVVIDNIEKNTPIYNLSGQRLDKPRKGINIIGGKKVMMK